MKHNNTKRLICFAVVAVMGLSAMLTGCSGNQGNPDKVKLDPENPVTITVWHYYNGNQLDAFNALIEEYNDTEGREKGILVDAFGQGSVSDLEKNVLAAANKEVGAQEVPNVFAAYADTAYAVDQIGLAADLSGYFTQKELDSFVESYIEEGRFLDSEGLKIFPVAKSTEVFMLNKTAWDEFAEATGCSIDELKTIEGVTAVAQKYYEWTDSQTPEANDGRAFFGRDAMANYMLIGAMELGKEIFVNQDGKTVISLDRDVAKALWDNYYIPYVKGYFASSKRFRSDDVKVRNIISFVGSSSGATFFPQEVVYGDKDIRPIELAVLPSPQFKDGEPYAVQQGAGMVVTRGTPEEIYASVQFLKWFTDSSRNIQFSVGSGYLPVKKQANDVEEIRTQTEAGGEAIDEVMEKILTVAIDTVQNNTLYTPKAFRNGTDARKVLEYSMLDKAKADRELVKAELQKGISLEEAAAPFESEENFEAWYEGIYTQLQSLAD